MNHLLRSFYFVMVIIKMNDTFKLEKALLFKYAILMTEQTGKYFNYINCRHTVVVRNFLIYIMVINVNSINIMSAISTQKICPDCVSTEDLKN